MVFDSHQKVPYYVEDSLWIGYDNEHSFSVKVWHPGTDHHPSPPTSVPPPLPSLSRAVLSFVCISVFPFLYLFENKDNLDLCTS